MTKGVAATDGEEDQAPLLRVGLDDSDLLPVFMARARVSGRLPTSGTPVGQRKAWRWPGRRRPITAVLDLKMEGGTRGL